MKIELLAYTQANPALDAQNTAAIGDLATIWKGKGTDAENIIEFAGRVCYRSTQRMGTAPDFIFARVREGHEDIIEHIVVTLRVSGTDEPLRWRMLNRHCEVSELGDGSWIVSGNTRVWLDLFRRGIALEAVPMLRAITPAIFTEFRDQRLEIGDWRLEIDHKSPISNLQSLFPAQDGPMRVTLLGYTQPQIDDATVTMEHGAMEHGAATFLFEGISRTCTHQLVRHRLASFSQESQRYCNYDALEANLAATVPGLPQPKEPKTDGLNLFSPDQEKFIVSQYNKEFSCEALAEAYDAHPTTIREIVMRNGGKIRDRQTSRSLHIETDYFDQIDSPLKARILGLIYADGNVAQADGEILHASITQHADYGDWLARLGRLWGGNVISGGREQSLRLSIPGKKLANALVKHGVVPAKSKILQPPQIADEFIRHFILGYLEGDGHIGRYPNRPVVTFVGTKSMLEWIRTHISMAIGKEPSNVTLPHDGECYQLTFDEREQSPRILEWLYDGSDVLYAHPAKLERAIEWSEKVAAEYNQQVGDWGKKFAVIVPPKIGPKQYSIFVTLVESAAQTYANLRHLGIRKEDARFLLPNAAETRIVATMNFAGWSHFLWLRAVDKAAQWEIRALGQHALKMLYTIAPKVFQPQWDLFVEKFGGS